MALGIRVQQDSTQAFSSFKGSSQLLGIRPNSYAWFSNPSQSAPVYLSIFLCFFPPHFSLETSSHMVILALSQISLFISGYLHLGHGLLLLLAPSAPTQTSSLGSDLVSSDFINQAASPAGGSPSSPEPLFLPSVHHTSLLLLSCWSPSTDSQLHEG